MLAIAVVLISSLIALVRKLCKKPAVVFKWIALAAFLVAYAAFFTMVDDVSSTLIITSILVLFVAFASCLYAGILRARKRNYRPVILLSLGTLAGAVILFSVAMGMSSSFSSTLILLSLIAGVVASISLLVFAIASFRKRSPAKSPGITTLTSLCLTIVLAYTSNAVWEVETEEYLSNMDKREVSVQIEPDFEVKEGTKPIVVEEYSISEQSKFSNRFAEIHDAEHLGLLLEKTGATEQDCLDAIEANSNIDAQFKELLKDYVHRYHSKYPEACMDVLCANLSTLTFTVLSERDFFAKSLSIDSAGVYFNSENAIYVPEGTAFVEDNGEFGFQVILHEISHAARTHWLNGKNSERADFGARTGDDSKLLEECMNSVFSCSLLNYYEWDIAYQVPSNYLRIMLECMDNYTMSDYINRRDTYFLRKLDEATGHVNYAEVMWKLITLQRSDFERDQIALNEEEYYPIYDYLCEIWYPRHIAEGMSYEQALEVADDLVYRAFFDAPDDYTITPQRFYDNLDAYFEDR